MSRPSTSPDASAAAGRRSTARASLAAPGAHVRHLDQFGPIRERATARRRPCGAPPTATPAD
jgi:hypothetical protein